MAIDTFYHSSVLLKEAVDGLNICASGSYVDATYGGGGHAAAILQKLGDGGKLFAFDQDKDAWSENPLSDTRFTPIHENFRYIRRFLRLHQQPLVDGILADLGVSSWQFDTAARGFSTRFDGPLDMRMDHRSEKTAATVLLNTSEAGLQHIFEAYGEVRNARQLARHIVQGRTPGVLSTIEGFKSFVTPLVKGLPHKYFAQLFQALRIEVNDELAVLEEFLGEAAQCLAPGGRLCVITFHSLEDRIVKQFIRNGKTGPVMEDPSDPFGRKPESLAPLRAINTKPIEPTDAEIAANSRARSAKLRIAERISNNNASANS